MIDISTISQSSPYLSRGLLNDGYDEPCDRVGNRLDKLADKHSLPEGRACHNLWQANQFGKTTVATGSKADDFGFRFSTKLLDEETNHYYYGYRYYQADTGKWLNRDPIGEVGGPTWQSRMEGYFYAIKKIEAFYEILSLLIGYNISPIQAKLDLKKALFAPSEQLGGANLYSFIYNNEINFINYLGLSAWNSVPGNKGWEFRFDQGAGGKDPQHLHFRKNEIEYARRSYSDLTQKKHGKGVNKDIPQKVIDAATEAIKDKWDDKGPKPPGAGTSSATFCPTEKTLDWGSALKAAGAYAVIAAGAGQLGPQVVLPEEIITVPVAAIVGFVTILIIAN